MYSSVACIDVKSILRKWLTAQQFLTNKVAIFSGPHLTKMIDLSGDNVPNWKVYCCLTCPLNGPHPLKHPPPTFWGSENLAGYSKTITKIRSSFNWGYTRRSRRASFYPLLLPSTFLESGGGGGGEGGGGQKTIFCKPRVC